MFLSVARGSNLILMLETQ